MMLENGAYERHIRHVRRRNAERWQTLLDALHRRFRDRIHIAGAAAGQDLVVWFRDLPRESEAMLTEAARAKGVGIYPISPLFDLCHPERRPDMSGVVMGYAALEPRQIEHGYRPFAEAAETILAERKRIKLATIANRRLQHRLQAT